MPFFVAHDDNEHPLLDLWFFNYSQVRVNTLPFYPVVLHVRCAGCVSLTINIVGDNNICLFEA